MHGHSDRITVAYGSTFARRVYIPKGLCTILKREHFRTRLEGSYTTNEVDQSLDDQNCEFYFGLKIHSDCRTHRLDARLIPELLDVRRRYTLLPSFLPCTTFCRVNETIFGGVTVHSKKRIRGILLTAQPWPTTFSRVFLINVVHACSMHLRVLHIGGSSEKLCRFTAKASHTWNAGVARRPWSTHFHFWVARHGGGWGTAC